MSGPEGGLDESRHNAPPFTRNAVYIGWFFEGALIGVAFGLGWFLSEPPHITMRWDLAALGLGVAATGPMLLGLVLLTWLPLPAFRRLTNFFDQFGRPFFAPYSILDLGVLSLLAGFGEEMLFRAVIQGAVAHRIGIWSAWVVASLLFGLMHAITPTYVVLATIAGLYLGGVWLLTDNLVVAIVAHALYDFLALIYLLRVKTAD
jgi:membrane protease YdiL (CAAX protease family)